MPLIDTYMDTREPPWKVDLIGATGLAGRDKQGYRSSPPACPLPGAMEEHHHMNERMSLERSPNRFNLLAGASHAQNIRHVVARCAFLNALLSYPKVTALFTQWLGYAGTAADLRRRAAVLDRVAAQVGLQGRSQLLDPLFFKEVSHKVTKALESEMLCALAGWRDPFYQEEGLAKRIAEEAGSFVVETCRLPWSWLSLFLIKFFFDLGSAFLTGDKFRFRYYFELWCEPIEPPAPHIKLHFRQRRGETAIQALQRLTKEVSVVSARLKAAKKSFRAGRIPADIDHELHEGVGEYARWFYAHQICRVPIRRIARARHDKLHPNKDFANCGCRSLVQYGIRQAERLLSETPYDLFQLQAPLPK